MAEEGANLILLAQRKGALEEVRVGVTCSHNACSPPRMAPESGIAQPPWHAEICCWPVTSSILHLQVAEICKKKGSQKVDVMPVDLSDMSQVDKFAEEVLKKYGTVDVLVNNAAILGPISYEGDATKNPNMGQGPIDGKL